MLSYNSSGSWDETDTHRWRRQDAWKMHRLDRDSSGVSLSNDFCGVGRIGISTRALLSETVRRWCLCGSIAGPADSRSDWATLGWVGYSLITHTGSISGTHGFVYASAHPNGTWQLPPPPTLLSLSFCLTKRMDRLTLSAAWHYSGPHFPFWDAWPHTAPSSPRSESLPASNDNTSSQHITEMTKGLWWRLSRVISR